MNLHILHPDVQQFIETNLDKPIPNLVLKGSPFSNVSIQELANQITVKKKAKTKLPTWFSAQNIYYPPKLNLEQTSSEVTSQYKSQLIKGDVLVDITGGFGIDSYYFSKSFSKIIHCELNQELSDMVQHNFTQLKVENVVYKKGDGIEFIEKLKQPIDSVFVDPSRRNESKGKVYLLEDCLPNIEKHLPLLLSKSKQVLVKLSPMLDISEVKRKCTNLKEIHTVAVKNEVKELLFLFQKDFLGIPKIETINFSTNKIQKFNFFPNPTIEISYSEPQTYLYEPNSAILKSGGFLELSSKYKVYKLHKHSHLYTSTELIDFPGRIFKISGVISSDKKSLKKLNISKANITTRNFPKTVAQIRKEFKIKDGGEIYLFFTKTKENKHKIIVCYKA